MSHTIWYLPTSEGMITVLLGCVVFLLVRIWITSGSRKYNLPPGPRSYPIIGNLPTFFNTKELPRKLLKLKEIYGKTFMLYLGPFPIVMITDLPTIREGLVEKGEFTKGRANWIYWLQQFCNKQGVVFSSGQIWKDMRRFAIISLKDLGMGKQRLQLKIYEELAEVIKSIELKQGRPFDLKKQITDAVINNMYNIIFGERMEYDDPHLEEIKYILDFFFENGSIKLVENFLPWPEYIPWKTVTKQVVENDKRLQVLFYQKIQEHRETFDENNIRDFVDMYLLTVKKAKEETLTEQNVFRTIVDIFLAGSETTATTLIWLFLYVTKYPDVQNKCREEIAQVTGMNRLVRMEDKKDLPYVCATINEVQRIATIVPATIPHVAEQDITLNGYDIPKGTIIQFMIAAAHKDPKYWKNPGEFDPSRWIDEDGKLKQKEAFLPFSMGPRACLGEPLARMGLILLFTNLIQKFEFLSDKDQPVSVSGSITAATYQPDSSTIRVRPIDE